MADEGIGRQIGASPSTEFAQLSGVTASSPLIAVTATAVGSAQTIHTADAQATDVLYVQAFNNSANSATIYAQLGTTATTSSIPLSLNAGTSGFLINGLPVANAAVVSVWTSTATNVLLIGGSVQRTYV